MKLNNWHKGVVVTLIAHTIWGVAAPMVKLSLDAIPPFSLLFLRSLFVCLLLAPIYEFILLPRQKYELTKKDKWDIFLAGFLGVFLNLAFYFAGQKLTTVIDAFVILSMGTPILIIFSYLFLKERLSKIVYVGSMIAFVGTLVIIGSPILSFGKGSLLGNVLALGATISAIASFLIIKRLITKLNGLTLVFYFFLVSLVCSLPFFVWDFIQNPIWLSQVPTNTYWFVAFLVFGSSIGAYFLSNFGLKFIPPSIASTIGYISTVVGVASGIMFLGEKPTISFVIGSALIIFGLLLAETRHKAVRKP
jgi:drug/metabolite transporter (DMT)-like permease